MKLRMEPRDIRVNPASSAARLRWDQEEHYKDGSALRGHINVAHNGKVDPSCFACKEIQRKQAEAGHHV